MGGVEVEGSGVENDRMPGKGGVLVGPIRTDHVQHLPTHGDVVLRLRISSRLNLWCGGTRN